MTATLGSRADRSRSTTLEGLGCVLVAMIVLPGQDAVAKYLSAAVSPAELTWARFALQTAFTLPLVLAMQGRAGLVPRRLWPNLGRGALVAASSMLFFVALKFMPMADALAIFFIEPFILVLLAALIDKEPVGWGLRLAIAAGFAGVLIVVRPSYDVLGAVSLIPALAGTLFAVYAFLNRRLAAFDSALTMQLTAGVSALAIVSVALMLGSAFSLPGLQPAPIGWSEAGWLLLMGIAGTSGHLMFVQGARLAPSSLIAPMQYVEIAAAGLLGYLVFGDLPDAWKCLGITIIVGSGAVVLLGEARPRRRRVPDEA